MACGSYTLPEPTTAGSPGALAGWLSTQAVWAGADRSQRTIQDPCRSRLVPCEENHLWRQTAPEIRRSPAPSPDRDKQIVASPQKSAPPRLRISTYEETRPLCSRHHLPEIGRASCRERETDAER